MGMQNPGLCFLEVYSPLRKIEIKYIYILRVLKQAFLIKQGFQEEVTNKPLSSLEEGLWTCERNKIYKTFLQD